MSEISGSLVKGVAGAGTNEDDTLAYVQLDLGEGGLHALAFDPEISSGLISAIATITNHLMAKQNLRNPDNPKSVIPWEIDAITPHVSIASDGKPHPVLQLSTKSQGHVYVVFHPSLLSQLISSLQDLEGTLKEGQGALQ